MVNVYYAGTTVRLKVVFSDPETAVAVDPTTVTIKTKDPSGTTTSQSVTKDSTGHYHSDVTVSVVGEWSWEAIGTGTYAGLNVGSFKVLTNPVG